MQLVVSQFEIAQSVAIHASSQKYNTAQSYIEFLKRHRYAFKMSTINLPLVLHQGQAIHYTLLFHRSLSMSATAPQTYPQSEPATSHLN